MKNNGKSNLKLQAVEIINILTQVLTNAKIVQQIVKNVPVVHALNALKGTLKMAQIQSCVHLAMTIVNSARMEIQLPVQLVGIHIKW